MGKGNCFNVAKIPTQCFQAGPYLKEGYPRIHKKSLGSIRQGMAISFGSGGKRGITHAFRIRAGIVYEDPKLPI